MSIQAIQTRYAGHHFRSRLEARWAVFFDALGLDWVYEGEGYVVGIGIDAATAAENGVEAFEDKRYYLPDFYLPGLDLFAEVKGDPAGADWPLWGMAVDGFATWRLPDSALAYGSGNAGSAIVVLGEVPRRPVFHPVVANHAGPRAYGVSWPGLLAGDLFGASVPAVDLDGLFDAWWAGFDADWIWNSGGAPALQGSDHGLVVPTSPLVTRALDKARTARFEHGETPLARVR